MTAPKPPLLRDYEYRQLVVDALHTAGSEQHRFGSEEFFRSVRAYLQPHIGVELAARLAEGIEVALADDDGGGDPPAPRTSTAGVRSSIAMAIDRACGALHADAEAPRGRAPLVPALEAEAPCVLLSTADSIARAAIARALIGARYDVRVFDSVSDMVAGARDRSARLLAILEMEPVGGVADLGELLAERPDLCVLALTQTAAGRARTLLEAMGVKRFAVLLSSASMVALLAQVRYLLRTVSPAAPAR